MSQYFPLPLAFLLLLITFSCVEEKTLPQSESIVYARIPAEPDRLNPILATSTYSRAINEQLFLNMLHFDPETLELSPVLAKSMPVIEEKGEGIAYTFEIHEEAVWDNGTPITGYDYAFTIKSILNPKVNAAHVRGYIEFISDVIVDPENPKKFTVLTDEKYIISEAVIGGFPPLPAYYYDADNHLKDVSVKQLADESTVAAFAENNEALAAFAEAFNRESFSRDSISGSGAYQFIEWETGQKVVIERKEDWWGNALVKDYPMLQAAPKKIVFRIIPSPTAMLAALKSQQIDVTAQIDAQAFTDLKDNATVNDQYHLFTPLTMTFYFIGMNNNNPKLADKRVRRALAHLVDVDNLIDNQFYGLAKRTIGPFHPTKEYYHKDLRPIPYSPDKARALLAEAGWEDTNNNGIVDKMIDGEQVELSLEYHVSSASKFANSQAIIFQNDAKQAGVDIKIIPKEFRVLIGDVKRRDYEIYSGALSQTLTVDDPKQLWHSESDTPDGFNRVSFNNAESDRLIEQIRETLDREERNKLYLQFQEIIYEEQPCIFLFAPFERIAISKEFDAEASIRRPGFFVNTFVETDHKQ
jgi:ABC-type transport system substrate-binding protein